ncbi:DUF4249 domain-containing protein [Maribacter sp. 2-571]|uniref:DUF4249 domain-containing protein n=1 Tax=Maribacter sp. 2-571 TaxID=3417569 RepID=UPI003D349104
MNKEHAHIRYIAVRCALALVVLLVFTRCVEPFELPESNFEEVFIVEATITNTNEFHTVKISNTAALGTSEAVPEQNASVTVLENDRAIAFEEIVPGTYRSVEAFEALPGTDYRLRIETQNGTAMVSETVRLSTTSNIGSVVAQKAIDENGIEGVNITVNSTDPSGESRYYRYFYEETYKIIAPRWSPFEAYVVTQDPLTVDIRPRQREERTCFKTVDATGSLLFDTTNQAEDNVVALPIRFIERSDFIIAHRYSILVKQLVQRRSAYEFYNNLQKLSNQGSLLSQNQPGFLIGNITVSGGTKKVSGFFDVASISENRIFFNYEDFFEDVTEPNYAVGCDVFLSPLLETDQFGNSPLALAIENETLEFFTDSGSPRPPGEGPFSMVPTICGDCNVLGTNIVPEFWID